MSKKNTAGPDGLAYSANKDFHKEGNSGILPANNTNHIYDEQVMSMLYQRRENHRNGTSKSYSAEDAIKLAKVK